jgi:hypothetical protein
MDPSRALNDAFDAAISLRWRLAVLGDCFAPRGDVSSDDLVRQAFS